MKSKEIDGKMVPIMLKKDLEEDVLQVFAEPYNIDKLAFRNPIPKIEGLAPKEHMKPWVDRKLFIHNLGHAAAAYLGFLHNSDFVYIYEVLEVPAFKDFCKGGYATISGPSFSGISWRVYA